MLPAWTDAVADGFRVEQRLPERGIGADVGLWRAGTHRKSNPRMKDRHDTSRIDLAGGDKLAERIRPEQNEIRESSVFDLGDGGAGAKHAHADRVAASVFERWNEALHDLLDRPCGHEHDLVGPRGGRRRGAEAAENHRGNRENLAHDRPLWRSCRCSREIAMSVIALG